jgi:predicted NAD/FAD-dependent oxidoreductase
VSLGNGTGITGDLAGVVKAELRDWFGKAVDEWRFLKAYHLPHSLPIEPPGHAVKSPQGGSVQVCGDYLSSASIEGAIRSGKRVAEEILTGTA